MAVKIITDSSADISAALAKQKDIEIIPLSILFPDGSEYLDGVDITKDEFYAKMASFSELPKTSQPAQPVFRSVFSRHLENGDEVVAVFISSELSGTCQAARLAQEELGSDRIVVVDSRNVSFGLCNIVLEAVRLRDLGHTAAVIGRELGERLGDLSLYAMIGTLRNLQRGGRLSGSAALIGGLLGIKPIAVVREGLVRLDAKERGPRRAYDYIIKQAAAEGVDTSRPVSVGHSHSPQIMDEFIAYIRDKIPGVDIAGATRCEIGATVGVHLGTGTVGIAFFKKR